MNELKGVDLKRACLVPSSVFASPEEVVRSDRLSLAQKLAVLRRWEFDARRGAGDRGRRDWSMLQSVQRALRRLDADGLANARMVGRNDATAASRIFADDPVAVDRRSEPRLHVGRRGTLGER